MTPYFETVKSFADVPVDKNGVDTAQFLEASHGLVKMFDLLGAGVFSFVQADIRSNIHGVWECYNAKETDTRITLERLVKSEVGSRDRPGTGCLRRLLRGLAFTCQSLKNSRENPSEELQTSFRRAYDAVLKHHHNFAIRTVVSVALKACPRRRDFYARIAQGGSQDRLDAELAKWLEGLDGIVKHMMRYYEESGQGRI